MEENLEVRFYFKWHTIFVKLAKQRENQNDLGTLENIFKFLKSTTLISVHIFTWPKMLLWQTLIDMAVLCYCIAMTWTVFSYNNLVRELDIEIHSLSRVGLPRSRVRVVVSCQSDLLRGLLPVESYKGVVAGRSEEHRRSI